MSCGGAKRMERGECDRNEPVTDVRLGWTSDGTGTSEEFRLGKVDRRALLLVASMLVAFGLMSSAALVLYPTSPTIPDGNDMSRLALTPHAPIEINSDADFASQGWPGAGTEADPYLVVGLEIDASGYRSGIIVGNTTMQFIVSGCQVTGATDAGISLLNVAGGAVLDNICQDNGWYGIALVGCTASAVGNNTCAETVDGVYLLDSYACTIGNNSCANLTGKGIRVHSSDNNVISDNYCFGNTGGGITLEASMGNRLTNNTCNNNVWGISLADSCSDTVLAGNSCSQNTGPGVSIVTSDNVTLRDGSSTWNTGGGNYGKGVYLVFSNGSTVMNYTCRSNQGDGISIYGSDGVVLVNNTCTGNVGSGALSSYDPGDGICLDFCHDAIVANNTCDANLGHGIELKSVMGALIENCSGSYNIEYGGSIKRDAYGLLAASSSDVRVLNCVFDGNDYSGMYLLWLDTVSVSGNSVNLNGFYGVDVHGCDGVEMTACELSSNSFLDLYISDTVSVVMRDNTFTGWGILMHGIEAIYWNTHDIDESNILNGAPVMYRKNETSGTVPAGASMVILASCTGMTVADQNIAGVDSAILLGFSDSNTIRNNTCTSNRHGAYFVYSDNNLLYWNTFALSHEIGLYISPGEGNVIWNNSFSSNVVQATEFQVNFWNISGIGNYWSDWASPDVNWDGIVDSPYTLPSGSKDYYPLTSAPPGVPELGVFGVAAACSILAAVMLMLGRRFGPKSREPRQRETS